MEFDVTMIEKAYKKLKSSVYFDKTQLILRNAIVEFEKDNNIDDTFHEIYNAINDESKFIELQKVILSSISVSSFPKKIHKDDRSVISNLPLKKVTIDELQHFISMSVEGHILGVLWIMMFGYKMDKEIYEHSYGNRIRKNLLSELSDKPTYSPYLFEPYFVQYESWRDKAMTEAQRHMSLGQDVVIITMDFRRYYYSVDADESVFNEIYNYICPDENDDESKILMRLNNFVCAVVEKYSKLFEFEFDKRHILPIGFLPSNILGNWCLKNFDKAIVDGWNPVYYGRYVDDILIVDKVEHNSDIYFKAQNEVLNSEEIIEFFLKQCSKWNNKLCCKENDLGLLEVDEEETQKAVENAKKKREPYKDIIVYHVNPKYNIINDNKSNIIVHNGKMKIFYFKSGESDSLLTSFKNNILKNKSEFRHLPEDEAVFQRDDYDEIYSLKNSESPNKLRGIDSIEIDKYELSKFLGKYLRIGGMIEDRLESRFEKDILKIFNLQTIVENYTAWEKVIEIFVINERFDAIVKFVTQIIAAIESIVIADEVDTKNVKESLYKYLHSILCRTFAIVWKKELNNAQIAIYSVDTFADSISVKYDNNGRFDEYLNDMQIAYCKFCMIDKSVLPINILMLPIDYFLSENSQINLTNFGDVLPIASKQWNTHYKYFPYVVNMYDLNMITFIEELKRDGDVPFSDYEKIHNQQKERYIDINYNIISRDYQRDIIERLISVRDFNSSVKSYLISIGDEIRSKLKIAVANVKLDHLNFKNLVLDMPNRRYSRYRDLSALVNQAIDQKADMLVMPEAYVPFEWLSNLARTCAKNNLAVVTGVEHIKMCGKIFNFTAIILPYSEEDYKCAYISFHLKKHYAPHEKELINGYRLQEVKGDHYELYKWNGCYFPVYCCYELTSISDRALFQSYADLLIAVEWNKDVNYYSNILESLSRDVHCYCVQVNTSDYGDSRITKPSKTEEKDIIRTKGGINSTILIGNVDINELREFQLKEYALQKGGKFKPTPPGFDSNIVLNKIKGESI